MKMHTMVFARVLPTASLLALVSAQLYPGTSNLNHTCAIQEPVLSCSAGASDPSAIDTWLALILRTPTSTSLTIHELLGNVRRPVPLHAILDNLHWS